VSQGVFKRGRRVVGGIQSRMSHRNVYSNFTQRIAPGETTFAVDNPNKFDDNIKRAFHFGYIEIVPEYVAEVAETSDMDDPEMNPSGEVEFGLRLTVKYNESYFKPLDDRKMAFKFEKGKYATSEVIKILNSTFELNKPTGLNTCPAVFDWGHPTLDRFRSSPTQFNKEVDEYADTLYPVEEYFSVATHKGYLPSSVRGRNFIDYKLPTEATYLSESRVRVTLLPGFKLVASNEHLWEAMGFKSEMWGGKRSEHKQIIVSNPSTTESVTFTASDPPQAEVTLAIPCQVGVFMGRNIVHLAETITTSLANERALDPVIRDLNAGLERMGRSIGYPLGCKINNESKMEFDLPADGEITTLLTLPDRLSRLLKLAPGHPVTPGNLTSLDPVGGKKLSPEEGLTYARILVLDTGPLTVSLDSRLSGDARQRPNRLMAYLRASDSVCAIIPDFKPQVVFPFMKGTLRFRIERNSDRDKVIDLNWPVGCFVHGVLVGTPI